MINKYLIDSLWMTMKAKYLTAYIYEWLGYMSTKPDILMTISVKQLWHYTDVIMGMIASQITSLTIVYSTVYSDADQRKYQSSTLLAFVRGIHRRPVNSPNKWPVMRKMFPFDETTHLDQHPHNLTWNYIHTANKQYCNTTLIKFIILVTHYEITHLQKLIPSKSQPFLMMWRPVYSMLTRSLPNQMKSQGARPSAHHLP